VDEGFEDVEDLTVGLEVSPDISEILSSLLVHRPLQVNAKLQPPSRRHRRRRRLVKTSRRTSWS